MFGTHFNTLLVLMAVCLLPALSWTQAARKPPAAQEINQPTLQETTDWISTRISGNGYRYSYTDDSGRLFDTSYKSTSLSFQSCQMDYTSGGCNYDKGVCTSIDSTKVSVQLKLLTNPAFTTLPFRPAGLKNGPKEMSTLTLNSQSIKAPAISGFRSVIDYTGSAATVSPPINLQGKDTLTLVIPFADKELGERMHKAFQHAISLCGGGKPAEKEPF